MKRCDEDPDDDFPEDFELSQDDIDAELDEIEIEVYESYNED